CEVVCALKHEGIIWPEASRVRVFEYVPGITIPQLCSQCSDYPCVNSCPTNALSVDEATGAVKVDESKCIKCGSCVEACPGRIPRILPHKNAVLICDLCGGDPECAKVC
ncbi:MAG: 4Fe-4S dicluster domain-containing protein, partial [Sulfolobales archaeon]